MKLDVIYNEECLAGMKKIPDQSIDAIICDLPYGTTACSWDTIIPFDKLWEQYNRITKKDSPIALFGAEPFSTMVRMSNLKDYRYDWYWEKNTATGFAFAKYQPMRSVETISVFYKEAARYFPQGLFPVRNPKLEKRAVRTSAEDIYNSKALSENQYMQELTGYPNNVLKFSKESKGCFHPTQKPVALLEYLVKTYTQEGDVVLDNCMGSGTTAIACLNTNRSFIGFEQDKNYFEKSLDRIRNNHTQLTFFDQ